MIESRYNGRSIQLRSSRQENGSWGCAYTILEVEVTRSSSVVRNDNGTFLTREEAEAAVLDAAQVEIDSRGPLS